MNNDSYLQSLIEFNQLSSTIIDNALHEEELKRRRLPDVYKKSGGYWYSGNDWGAYTLPSYFVFSKNIINDCCNVLSEKLNVDKEILLDIVYDYYSLDKGQ